MKLFVHTLSRPLLGAAAVAVAVSALAPPAPPRGRAPGAAARSAPAPAAPSPDAPVRTTPATAIPDTTATLNGVVGPQRGLTDYTFQYGVTTRYELPTRRSARSRRP